MKGLYRLAAAFGLAVAFTAVIAGGAGAATLAFDDMYPPSASTSGYQFSGGQTSEFGGAIGLAPGTAGHLANSASFVFASYACSQTQHPCVNTPGATYSQPLTLKIYALGAGNSVGALLGTVNKTVTMPYRPSSGGCDDPDAFVNADNVCAESIAVPVTFDLASLNLVMPASAIVTISWDTSNYGAHPRGTNTACFAIDSCPYDYLRLGNRYDAPATLTGSLPAPDDLYIATVSSFIATTFCTGGSASGLLARQPGCGHSAQPQIRFDVSDKVPTMLTALPQTLALIGTALHVRLTRNDTGAPIPGQPVTMSSGATLICTATTDVNGVATCTTLLKGLGVLLGSPWSASFAGSAAFLGSSVTTNPPPLVGVKVAVSARAG